MIQQWLAIGALLLLVGCGSFNREWRETVDNRSVPATDFTGPWEGTWNSEATGHRGRLRAIITAVDDTIPGEPGLYEFYYQATWAAVLRGSFRTRFQVDRLNGERFRVEGEHPIGGYGTYRQMATIGPESFEADYEAGFDRGHLTLERP